MSTLGFWTIATNDPDRVALVDPDHQEHTAGELLAATNQVVHGLRALRATVALRESLDGQPIAAEVARAAAR